MRCSRLRGNDGGRSARFSVTFVTSPTSAARGCSGVIRRGDPPYTGPIWPDLARFTRRDLRSKPGMRGSRLHGNDGGITRSA